MRRSLMLPTPLPALSLARTRCSGARGCPANTLCLDPAETLSPDQAEEIDRTYRCYPELNDDALVREHLERWLA